MTYYEKINLLNGTYSIGNSHTTHQLDSGLTLNAAGTGITEDSKWHENTIEINGKVAVTANGIGLSVGMMIGGDQTKVLIGETGAVSAKYGVIMSSSGGSLVNHGQIIGQTIGISTGYAGSDAINTGTIKADTAVYISKDHTKLTNSGHIEGLIDAKNGDGVTINLTSKSIVLDFDDTIHLSAAAGTHSVVTNAGTISAGNYAYLGSLGNETFTNHGKVTGTIDLREGNDTFDNRGGTLDSATFVYGGTGNDTFIVDGKTKIIELNDQGTDTVKSAASINLFSDYTGQSIEKLALLGKANINGTGNNLANALGGNSANNTLSGMGGQDRIAGGKGNDTLTGGADADTFVFKTGYGKDTVTDFENGKDHIDLKGWTSVTDFADLKAHHMVVSGADIIIKDGADWLTLKDTTKGELDASDFLF